MSNVVTIARYREIKLLLTRVSALEQSLYVLCNAVRVLVPARQVDQWLTRRYILWLTLRRDDYCLIVDGHRHPASTIRPEDARYVIEVVKAGQEPPAAP
jgi:hypothetical protein